MVDHPSLDVEKLVVQNNSCFFPLDLDVQLPPPSNYDLVIFTEVLEHFEELRAKFCLILLLVRPTYYFFRQQFQDKVAMGTSTAKGMNTGIAFWPKRDSGTLMGLNPFFSIINLFIIGSGKTYSFITNLRKPIAFRGNPILPHPDLKLFTIIF